VPRPFETLHDDIDDVEWTPLERIALVACRSPSLPPFHPGEFMYMARLSARRNLRLHLYKHYDTRRYLNLDDNGHAYAYCGSSPSADHRSGGRYRQLRSLSEAILRLGLEGFDADPPLLRSFPPAQWHRDQWALAREGARGTI
jgi:hypothetical protein